MGNFSSMLGGTLKHNGQFVLGGSKCKNTNNCKLFK